MAGTAALILSTREKLERARAAAAKLAQLSTAQKNHLLLGIADIIEHHSVQILHVNQQDLQQSNLDGAMRALLRIIDREPKAAHRALMR